MNRPAVLDSLLSSDDSAPGMGAVRASPLLRALRPVTFALWIVLACAQMFAVLSGAGGTVWLMLVISTALFIGVHLQFWYEESEQGQSLRRSLEKVRGTIYEDEHTGLPNSRHFVFELRRQMMRSVRNGRGFSLVLTDLQGLQKGDYKQALPMVAKTLRQSVGDGDFVAHLDGPVFAAIVLDDRDRSGADKSNVALYALHSIVPVDRQDSVTPIVSLTGYQGELEVRDFLRRAQRDLIGARARQTSVPSASGRRAFSAA